MSQIIYSDSIEALEFSLFPEQHPNNMVYIQQCLSNYHHNLTESGRAFMDQQVQYYQSIDHEALERKARQAMYAASDIFKPDAVIPLETYEEIQNAKLVMQRCVMAHPGLRALYQRNLADGYSDTYYDMEPGRIGENHYDYRQVMTGHVIEDEDTGHFTARQYSVDLREGDKPFAIDQRVIIKRVYRIVERAIDEGVDISNIHGGELGK